MFINTWTSWVVRGSPRQHAFIVGEETAGSAQRPWSHSWVSSSPEPEGSFPPEPLPQTNNERTRAGTAKLTKDMNPQFAGKEVCGVSGANLSDN